MWKNVSRRLRDVTERCGLFEVHKTTVSTNSNYDEPRSQHNSLKCVDINFGNEQNREGARKRRKCKFGERNLHHTWLGALTWSSAIICGWYTSQLICLKSRRSQVECDLLKTANEHRCKYYKLMLVPSKLIHTSILSRLVFNSPIHQRQLKSSNSYSPVPSTPSSGYHSQRAFSFDARSRLDLIAETEEFDNQKFVLNVNNENEEIHEPKEQPAHSTNSAATSTDEPDPILVESAMKNLLNVLGEMEFEMGVKNMLARNYDAAVHQLKLGAFHRHAGATFNLGLCFEQGLGCTKSMEKALECYHSAALMGHAKAMYNLAIFYLQGFGGLQKDRKMARRYFQAAADLGLPEAQRALSLKNQPSAPASNIFMKQRPVRTQQDTSIVLV